MKYTKILMTISAISYAMIGIACSFMPHELLAGIGVAGSSILPLIIQLLGALYLGFAILNWTAKANLIGGIYSKPVALANSLNYTVGALALVKYAIAAQELGILLIPMLIYGSFAILFGKVLFGSPV